MNINMLLLVKDHRGRQNYMGANWQNREYEDSSRFQCIGAHQKNLATFKPSSSAFDVRPE